MMSSEPLTYENAPEVEREITARIREGRAAAPSAELAMEFVEAKHPSTERLLTVLDPLQRWAHQCHGASVHLVRSGVVAPARVARGSCRGVFGQHSWVVLGNDCYAEDAHIIDPTLWSYDESVEGIWTGDYGDGLHVPHGRGSIWKWGRPDPPTGPVVELTPRQPFSPAAEDFLGLLGPLDYRGWSVLAHAPVEDWPAGEVYDAMYHTERLRVLVPIDIIGMTTDINPSGLYLPGGEGGAEDYGREEA